MKYLLETCECRSLTEAKELWGFDLNFKFSIEGWSDYKHGTDPHIRKGFCGHVTESNAIPVVIKNEQSEMQLYQLRKVKGLLEYFSHNAHFAL